MSNYTIHTAATAPQGAREALEGVQKQFGFVPNLMGVMAEAPSTLKAYLNLMQFLGETSFSGPCATAARSRTRPSRPCAPSLWTWWRPVAGSRPLRSRRSSQPDTPGRTCLRCWSVSR